MKTLSGLHHVGIVVEDIEASAQWYAEHLGFERLYGFSRPGVQAVFLGLGALRLEFFQNENAAPMADERRRPETNLRIGGINHFAIEVADLDATLQALTARGVAVVFPPRDVPNSGGSRYAFIHDNEQMLIELF
ncbi:VOC family protein [Acetobacteraceae bacterium KSS8]|uniref:VOC family protein n=1 Tax=Endosaccharibacter trunci TaxID=2812733 RepID=A0ABT1W4H6_9PROT|nr:VOC family protein [Acetobacteraceae bacterium KSS8]